LPQSDAFIAQVFAQARILSARIAELREFPSPSPARSARPMPTPMPIRRRKRWRRASA
jgi:hypothetical protein